MSNAGVLDIELNQFDEAVLSNGQIAVIMRLSAELIEWYLSDIERISAK